MSNNIVKIGSSLKWRGVYNSQHSYYMDNIVTLRGCVFRCKVNQISNCPPLERDTNTGEYNYINTNVWDVLVDNKDNFPEGQLSVVNGYIHYSYTELNSTDHVNLGWPVIMTSNGVVGSLLINNNGVYTPDTNHTVGKCIIHGTHKDESQWWYYNGSSVLRIDASSQVTSLADKVAENEDSLTDTMVGLVELTEVVDDQKSDITKLKKDVTTLQGVDAAFDSAIQSVTIQAQTNKEDIEIHRQDIADLKNAAENAHMLGEVVRANEENIETLQTEMAERVRILPFANAGILSTISSPVEGGIYYDTVYARFSQYTEGSWVTMSVDSGYNVLEGGKMLANTSNLYRMSFANYDALFYIEPTSDFRQREIRRIVNRELLDSELALKANQSDLENLGENIDAVGDYFDYVFEVLGAQDAAISEIKNQLDDIKTTSGDWEDASEWDEATSEWDEESV